MPAIGGGYGGGGRPYQPPPRRRLSPAPSVAYPTPNRTAPVYAGADRTAPSPIAVASTPSGQTRVLSYLGTPVRNRPSVSAFLSRPQEYLTPGGNLRERYQGDEEGRRRREARAQQSLFNRLNRGFAPGETISPRETALLHEAVGLPGRTYSKAIVPGESGYQPGVRNPDDDTPSLDQITPSVQSAETQARFNRIAARYPGGYSNPIASVKMARVLAAGSPDEGVSNYVAFDPSAPQGHLRGGKERARQLLGWPGEGGGTARGRTGPRPLRTSESFYDPGINLADGQRIAPIGGHGTHGHYGSEDPRSILRAAGIAQRMGLGVRENPAFEPVDPVHTEGSMHYEEVPIPNRLNRLARRVGAEGGEVGTAIDVTGAPEDLSRFNRRISRLSGAPVTNPGSQTISGATAGVPSVGAPTAPGYTRSAVRQSGRGLRDVLSRAGGGGGGPQVNPLAPRPRTRSEEGEEEEELATLLERLGRL